MEGYVVLQEERVKLVEIESFLSYESLCFEIDFEEMFYIQIILVSFINMKKEYEKMEVFNVSCDYVKMKVILMFLLIDEDFLFFDIVKIMKIVCLDFIRCLWEDEEWYNFCFFFLLFDDSFVELNKFVFVFFLI